jgi:[ribosomal protein S5]-alanine N-acetyltransferase
MKQFIPKDYTIQTSRCLLRIPSAADIPHIFAATRVAGFNDGMVWEPPTKMEELSEPLLNNLLAWEAGTNFTFTMVDRSTGQLVGRISIRQIQQEHVWNIGYWTHPVHQRQGYMTEAAKAILNFGFQKLDAMIIEAGYAVWNIGSRIILERIGMKFVEYLPQGFQKKGNGLRKIRWQLLSKNG